MNVDEIVKGLRCEATIYSDECNGTNCTKCKYSFYPKKPYSHRDLYHAAADLIERQQAKVAELEAEANRLATKCGCKKAIRVLKELARNSHDEVKRLRTELSVLQAHSKEAIELLEAAVADAEYLAYLVKNAGEKCNICYKSDKSCRQSSDCWRWQHTDRYEALKAQEGGLNGTEIN